MFGTEQITKGWSLVFPLNSFECDDGTLLLFVPQAVFHF